MAKTAGEYAWHWMEQTNQLRPTTRAQYERHLRLRIVPTLGTMALRDLTRERIVKWWASRTSTSTTSARPA